MVRLNPGLVAHSGPSSYPVSRLKKPHSGWLAVLCHLRVAEAPISWSSCPTSRWGYGVQRVSDAFAAGEPIRAINGVSNVGYQCSPDLAVGFASADGTERVRECLVEAEPPTRLGERIPLVAGHGVTNCAQA